MNQHPSNRRRQAGEGTISAYQTKAGERFLIKYKDHEGRMRLKRGYLDRESADQAVKKAIQRASMRRSTMVDGVILRGVTWSYVVRVTDPTTGKRKPKWVGGFESRDTALEARTRALSHPATARDYIGRPLPLPPSDSPLRVYFMERHGLIKIGITKNVIQRRKELAAKLLTHIPGSRELEQALHHRFGLYWSHGEWFFPGDGLLAFIESLNEGITS
jgi:hypothetical protein